MLVNLLIQAYGKLQQDNLSSFFDKEPQTADNIKCQNVKQISKIQYAMRFSIIEF